MFLSILIMNLLNLMSLLMFLETKDLRIFFVPAATSILQSLLLLKSWMEYQHLKKIIIISDGPTSLLAKEQKRMRSESLMDSKPMDSQSS